jgi:hypothetical protein
MLCTPSTPVLRVLGVHCRAPTQMGYDTLKRVLHDHAEAKTKYAALLRQSVGRPCLSEQTKHIHTLTHLVLQIIES